MFYIMYGQRKVLFPGTVRESHEGDASEPLG